MGALNSVGVVTATSTTGPSGTTSASYTPDAAGNTISGPGQGGQQTLGWDAEGHLSTITDRASNYRYVDAADGSRLVALEPGATISYLGAVHRRDPLAPPPIWTSVPR